MRSFLFIAALALVAYYLIRRNKESNDSVVKDFQMRRDLDAIGGMKLDVWQRAERPIMSQGEMPLTDVAINPWWPTPTAKPRDAQYLPRLWSNPYTISIDPKRALLN